MKLYIDNLELPWFFKVTFHIYVPIHDVFPEKFSLKAISHLHCPCLHCNCNIEPIISKKNGNHSREGLALLPKFNFVADFISCYKNSSIEYAIPGCTSRCFMCTAEAVKTATVASHISSHWVRTWDFEIRLLPVTLGFLHHKWVHPEKVDR